MSVSPSRGSQGCAGTCASRAGGPPGGHTDGARLRGVRGPRGRSHEHTCKRFHVNDPAMAEAAAAVGVLCCCPNESDAPRMVALLEGLASADVATSVQQLDAIQLDFAHSRERAGHELYYAIYSAACPQSVATCVIPCSTANPHSRSPVAYCVRLPFSQGSGIMQRAYADSNLHCGA